jgi:hypothetical protein
MPVSSSANSAIPFIATEVKSALADVGSLPGDLLAAFNGAVHAASLARNIVFFLTSEIWLVPREGVPGEKEVVIAALKALYANANPARHALAAVVGQLNDARRTRGPVRFGTLKRANAHEVALDGAANVRLRIRFALLASKACDEQEPDAVRRLVDDSAAPMDLDLAARHMGEVWRHFDADGLPDFDQVLAEIKIEASMAAAARDLGGKLRSNLDRMREGYAREYGDAGEKKQKALAAYQRIIAEKPDIKRTEAQKRAGAEAGVSARQVRTYLKKNRGSL